MVEEGEGVNGEELPRISLGVEIEFLRPPFMRTKDDHFRHTSGQPAPPPPIASSLSPNTYMYIPPPPFQ